jgi:hypothetical protein
MAVLLGRNAWRVVFAIASVSGAALGCATGSANGSGSPGDDMKEPPEDGGFAPDARSNDPDDRDGDGFTAASGDCNDDDGNANPGALDTAGNGVDEDCNGVVDDNVTLCDANLTTVDDTDPVHGAQAIGLCKRAAGQSWGLVSAKYVKADGSPGMNPVSHGILPNFGPNVSPREGTRMLALSSGTARRPADEGYYPPTGSTYMVPGGFSAGTWGPAPTGYPIDFPACPGVSAGNTTAIDPAALEITVRVPTNARSAKFRVNFYAAEFPSYVCQAYNDFFVALQSPAPPSALSGNVSFDAAGNAISVNNGFLEVCTSQHAGGKYFPCAKGTSELVGTGYEERGATSWLETVTPVVPGSEVTFRFAVWDAGDQIFDALVLIDGFEFSAEDAGEPTTVVIL